MNAHTKTLIPLVATCVVQDHHKVSIVNQREYLEEQAIRKLAKEILKHSIIRSERLDDAYLESHSFVVVVETDPDKVEAVVSSHDAALVEGFWLGVEMLEADHYDGPGMRAMTAEEIITLADKARGRKAAME